MVACMCVRATDGLHVSFIRMQRFTSCFHGCFSSRWLFFFFFRLYKATDEALHYAHKEEKRWLKVRMVERLWGSRLWKLIKSWSMRTSIVVSKCCRRNWIVVELTRRRCSPSLKPSAPRNSSPPHQSTFSNQHVRDA